MMNAAANAAAAGAESSSREEELKTHFLTREGTYRLLTLSEYSRPNRIGYGAAGLTANSGPVTTTMGSAGGGSGSAAPVRVSFVSVPNSNSGVSEDESAAERISFNFGRELFVYPYKGLRKAADLTKPIDKRVYKGTCPTCHDFGLVSDNSDIIPLLVGFSGGQIQLIDPVGKELSTLYNEDRIIDKTRVTCIKWIPGSSNYFLVSHASGNMYIYNYDLSCSATPPLYQLFKSGATFSVFTCKTKSSRNPLYKWTVGRGSINEFIFSPDGHFLAVVTQDGYLHVFNYDTMDLVGTARSYFGGLLCVCWSPDGKYIVCGGEDDLVTVYSLLEKRVVVRGQGHKAWVSQVSFDQYNMSYGDLPDGLDFSGSEDDESGLITPPQSAAQSSSAAAKKNNSGNVTCYRFGSVGQDTYICLWDITEDVLKQAYRNSLSSVSPSSNNPSTSAAAGMIENSNASSPNSSLGTLPSSSNHNNNNSLQHLSSNSDSVTSRDSGVTADGSISSNNSTSSLLTHKLASLNFGSSDKKERNKFSFNKISSSSSSSSSSSKNNPKTSSAAAAAAASNAAAAAASGTTSNGSAFSDPHYETVKLGSPQCPRIHEIPVIEPLVIKKIAHERLTSLVFKEECLVTACQDGYVSTWARPGRINGGSSGSPLPSSAGGNSGSNVNSNGGTIV